MALVDGVVANGLSHKVIRDGPDSETVALEDLATPGHIVVLGQCSVDLEVVAPAGDLETVVTPGGGQTAYLLEGKVGPLAGEEGDRTRHRVAPWVRWGAGVLVCVGNVAAMDSTPAARSTRVPSVGKYVRCRRDRRSAAGLSEWSRDFEELSRTYDV